MGLGVKISANNDLLLNYSLNTNPAPLVVSPQDSVANPTIASLEIAVSNNSAQAIYCSKIIFSFMVSDTAQGLTDYPDGILCAVSPDNQWQISQTNAGEFTATPLNEGYGKITTQGLVFQIYNIRVNKTVGNAEFYVEETSGPSEGSTSIHNGTYYIAKFPYGFYVTNYYANKPFINDQETVTLSWLGSVDAIYTLYYSPSIPPLDVSQLRTWTSGPLTQSTEFQLTVKAQELGETVDMVLSVTVIVTNPEIVAASLRVQGASNLNTLNTTGQAVLNSLQVTNQSTLPTANITTLNLNGALAGSITLNATMAGIQTFQVVTPATFVANTDGIIIGSITAPTGDSNRLSYGIIGGRSNTTTIFATGGYSLIRYLGVSNVISASQYGNFCLPVPKGATWSVAYEFYSGNEVAPAAVFYWVALSSNNGQPTYTKTLDTPSVTFPS